MGRENKGGRLMEYVVPVIISIVIVWVVVELIDIVLTIFKKHNNN